MEGSSLPGHAVVAPHRPRSRARAVAALIRHRHSDEWIGLLVIATVVVFVGAVLEAGVLRDLFRPVSHLRLILPDAGVGGLARGGDVEVLGTHAGTVRRIVLNPDQQMYAEADLDAQATSFIRRDSRAVIRRRFGLAGAAYVEISRGTGVPLDWSYAVIEATTERAPTDTLSTMIDEIHQKLIPALDDARQTMAMVASVAGGLQKGQGTLGRLLTDDTLVRQAEATVAALSPVMEKLNQTADNAEQTVRVAKAAMQDVQELVRDARKQLGSRGTDLTTVLRSAARATEAVERVMASLDTLAAPHSRFRGDLEAATRDLSATASSFRGLAQALERDPSIVLRGRSSR